MVFHSKFNNTDVSVQACGTSILPIKTKLKAVGVPTLKPEEKEEDIIDEVLKYFKPNTLFKSFEINGGADRVLIYLTFYVHQCLLRIERKKCQSKAEAEKILFSLAQEDFNTPDEANFLLGGFFFKSKTPTEKNLWKSYMKIAREETGTRLLEKLFNPTIAPDGAPSKFWMQFVKRKFLNKAFEN